MRDTKIYMDVCCLNRPFDDLSQDRLYFESEAVLTILSHCEHGKWILVSSGIIDYELSKLPDIERFKSVQSLCSIAKLKIKLTTDIEEKATYFQTQGLKPFDSLHLAIAEVGGADVFLTTDDRLLKNALKLNLSITVANPVTWLMEVSKNEY